MKEDSITLITIIIIALVISLGLVGTCLIKATAEADALRLSEDALRLSERAALEQVQELRSTMAAQGMGELF